MIGNVMPSLVQMEPELSEGLLIEGKEPIADEVEEPEIPHRPFSIVDLWNIRRNSNSARNRFGR